VVVPISVLVVVGDPSDGLLRSDDEVDAILSALGSRHGEWHVEVAYAPTQPAFFQTLEAVQPHVLHFLGHSGLDIHSGDAGLQIRPGGPDDAWTLTGDLLDNVVDEAPRLVFLNACRTAAESGASRTVSAAFVEHGACAVIAMQGDIPSGSAIEFTETVYRALAAWQPLDVAVRLGRRALMKLQQPVQRDWALPTLTVGVRPERVRGVVVVRQVVDEQVEAVPRDEPAPDRRRIGVDRSEGPVANRDRRAGLVALVERVEEEPLRSPHRRRSGERREMPVRPAVARDVDRGRLEAAALERLEDSFCMR